MSHGPKVIGLNDDQIKNADLKLLGTVLALVYHQSYPTIYCVFMKNSMITSLKLNKISQAAIKSNYVAQAFHFTPTYS